MQNEAFRSEKEQQIFHIPFEEMTAVFESILKGRGVSEQDAYRTAVLFAQTSADGVYSHGVNRFPRVISYIDKGYIKVDATARMESAAGALERWNGHLGLGNLNAWLCMERACALAHQNGVGIVALRNTNHWMRGGSYGWQAADNHCVGICWTNTMPNMPPWGGVDCKIGNNPFIVAVPRASGQHLVIDCAMSQFAYGKIEEARMKGQRLPVPGGFDEQGNLTDDPAMIEKTWRVLPIGFWKGSGLSMVLDLAGAVLSGGNTVTDIGQNYDDEYALTQLFIAADPLLLGSVDEIEEKIDTLVADIKSSRPASGNQIFYPGEMEWKTRMKNMAEGIPVLGEVWEQVLSLQKK